MSIRARISLLLGFLLSASACVPASGQQVKTPYVIDLNAPNAIENLRTTNPDHYERIRQILDRLNDLRAVGPGTIQPALEASDVFYSPVLLTTVPAQRDLAFTLDRTRYKATVTLESRVRIYPTKH
jgi:hypothetical protein